jgi:sulfate/thiosulfate transport system permease protein
VTTTEIQPLDLHPPASSGGRVRRGRSGRAGTGIGLGLASMYLSIVVIIPLAFLVAQGFDDGWSGFWNAVTTPEAWAALKLTVLSGIGVAAANAVLGTLIAWVLVRDSFPGKRVLDTVIDLPFALPTIVAGIVIIALYGPSSPVGIDLAYKVSGVIFALLFVTLPFVVRTVQPVLLELDQQMEEAALSLGASRFTTFRRIILPNLFPAIAAGTGLAFARAISEFGATVLISGNIPLKTQVAPVFIYSQIESDRTVGAAAVSVVLLTLSLAMLLFLEYLQRFGRRRG